MLISYTLILLNLPQALTDINLYLESFKVVGVLDYLDYFSCLTAIAVLITIISIFISKEGKTFLKILLIASVIVFLTPDIFISVVLNLFLLWYSMIWMFFALSLFFAISALPAFSDTCVPATVISLPYAGSPMKPSENAYQKTCRTCGVIQASGARYCATCGTALESQPASTAHFCGNCGKEMQADEAFCSQCGVPVQSIQSSMPVGRTSGKANPWKIILPIASAVVVIVAAFFIVNALGKNSLKKQLMRDWSRTEGESGSYYELVLDFSDTKVDYNFEGSLSWLNSTLAEYEYKVLSPQKVEIDGYVYTIEFDNEKEQMVMTPALTSTDSYEYWYNFD